MGRRRSLKLLATGSRRGSALACHVKGIIRSGVMNGTGTGTQQEAAKFPSRDNNRKRDNKESLFLFCKRSFTFCCRFLSQTVMLPLGNSPNPIFNQKKNCFFQLHNFREKSDFKRRISPGNGISAGSEVVPAREKRRDQSSPAPWQRAGEGCSSEDDGNRDAGGMVGTGRSQQPPPDRFPLFVGGKNKHSSPGHHFVCFMGGETEAAACGVSNCGGTVL